MKCLVKYVWLTISAITLISCQGGNTTSHSSPATNLSPLAQYKALLVYNSSKIPSKTLNSATQNNQQSFTISNTSITLTNVRINFYQNNNCSRNSLVNAIDLSGGDGVVFQPGTYTSSGASNLALCGRYPNGCQALFESYSNGTMVAMNFEYTYAGGKVYSASCMAGSSDSNDGEAIINWSANSGLTPWSACTNVNCGFSQPYTVALPESSSLTSSFMLVGAGGMITNYNPYPGLLNNILYPTTVSIKSVAFTPESHVVAVGYSGVILVADDISGTNMKALNSGTINNLNSVTVSSNGIYVAVGDSGTILRSVDGINWQAAANTDSTSSNLNGVTVNQNGKFVAVGNNGSILSSNDGDNWNVADQVDSGINLYGVATNKSGTYYVAVGNNASGDSVILYFETNRSTVWNTATGSFNNGSTLYSVAATPTGGFAAVSDQGNVYYSTDNSGSQWSAYPSVHPAGSPAPALYGVSVDSNGTITVVGLDTDANNGVIYTANNPTTSSSWELVATAIDTQLNGVTSAGTDKYIAVGGYSTNNQVLMNSTNGQSWSTIPALTTNDLRGIAYKASGGFSAGGGDGTTLTSTNGINWSLTTIPSYGYILSILATNNGLFFLGDSNGTIESSSDGITWENSFSGSDLFITGIAQGENGLMVAVGTNKNILSSNNYGLSWSSLVPTEQDCNLFAVAVNKNGVFVAVGENSGESAIIYSSEDNYSNNKLSVAGIKQLNAITINSAGRFVAVGQTTGGSSVIFYSDNGNIWTQASISSSIVAPLYGIAVNSSGLFVAVGDSGLVLTSIDGVSWYQQTPIANGIYMNGITAY